MTQYFSMRLNMKEKYEPNYCVVTGNLYTYEWDKKDFDENDDSENDIDLVELKDNNKSINLNDLIKETRHTTYI